MLKAKRLSVETPRLLNIHTPSPNLTDSHTQVVQALKRSRISGHPPAWDILDLTGAVVFKLEHA